LLSGKHFLPHRKKYRTAIFRNIFDPFETKKGGFEAPFYFLPKYTTFFSEIQISEALPNSERINAIFKNFTK
jgi:hypothetical protein